MRSRWLVPLAETGSICLKNVLDRTGWMNGAYGFIRRQPSEPSALLCFALPASMVGAFGRWAFGRLGAEVVMSDHQPCFSSGTSFFLNLHPRPTSPSRRAHCARRERWGPSFGSWILDSGTLSTVHHRGERERFRFPDERASEPSDSVQRPPSVIGHTGRYPVLDHLSSADCAAPPFPLVRLSTCRVNIVERPRPLAPLRLHLAICKSYFFIYLTTTLHGCILPTRWRYDATS